MVWIFAVALVSIRIKFADERSFDDGLHRFFRLQSGFGRDESEALDAASISMCARPRRPACAIRRRKNSSPCHRRAATGAWLSALPGLCSSVTSSDLPTASPLAKTSAEASLIAASLESTPICGLSFSPRSRTTATSASVSISAGAERESVVFIGEISVSHGGQGPTQPAGTISRTIVLGWRNRLRSDFGRIQTGHWQ